MKRLESHMDGVVKESAQVVEIGGDGSLELMDAGRHAVVREVGAQHTSPV
jgi:hypothetical protein